jgi:hypothetical protein
MTFDEELLLWLGDETPQVRAADSERVHDIAIGAYVASRAATASSVRFATSSLR